MSTAVFRRIIDQFQDESDQTLLRRFSQHRDETAFAELLHRHGSLVLGVCRRLLGDQHAAEDAFQAVFVQLAQQAGRLRVDGTLAGWLHTVARRMALVAKRGDRRRERREQAVSQRETNSGDDVTWRELRELLDAELARLPEQQRVPLVLCYLEDRPQAEAAEILGWPLPTLRGRLERGRLKLKRRLERLGLPLAAPLLVLPTANSVGSELRDETLAAVQRAIAGQPLSPTVAALLGGTRSLGGWKLAAVGVFVLAAIGFGLVRTGGPAAMLPDDPPKKADSQPMAAADALGDPLPDGAAMRLGTRRFRLRTYPRDYVSLPDGKSFLLYFGNQISWMDAESGKITDTWTVPKGNVVGVSRDGRYALASTSFVFYTGLRKPGTVEKQEWALVLYDLRARKTVWEKSEQLEQKDWKRVERVLFSPDGKAIFTTGAHNTGQGRLWDVADGKELWRLAGGGESQYLEPLGFADDGNTIIFNGWNDKYIYMYDRVTGKELRNFKTTTPSDHRHVGTSPDGEYVFVGGAGTAVRVWETKSGKELAPLGGHADWGATAFAISGDGRTVVTGGDGKVRVWDWPSGKFRHAFDLGIGATGHLGLSHDGKRLEALAWFGSAICLYDVDTGKRRESLVDGHSGAVEGIESAPDGKLISIGRDKEVRTWDLKTGKTIARIALKDFAAQRPFAKSADGKLLVVAKFQEGIVQIIGRESGKVVQTLKSPERELDQIAMSPDGRFVAAVTAQQSKFIVWSIATGEIARSGELGGHQNSSTVAFSPDSRTLAASMPGAVRFWDTETWKERPPLKAYSQNGIAFSPDGRTLATASVEGVRVWELATLKQRFWIRPGAYPSHSLTFSPSGKWLAWVANRNVVEVCDMRTGEALKPFEGHEEDVTGLAWLGERIASSSADTTILIWDLASRAP